MKCVYGRAGVRYVITKFSGMDSLPNFLTHDAPLCALRARGSSAIIFPKTLECNLTYYESENFSDSSLHHISESENFRFPFLNQK